MFKESKHDQDHLLARFVRAIENLVNRSHEGLATKHDLCEMENRIMATIQEYADRVNRSYDTLGSAVDAVASDVKFLKDKITEMQNNPGPISAQDQALLDALETRAASVVAKVEALDAATENPPTPPTP